MERVFLTAGLRAERSPGFGETIGTVISPRVGAAYAHQVGPVAMKLRLSYGESIRAPLRARALSVSTGTYSAIRH